MTPRFTAEATGRVVMLLLEAGGRGGKGGGEGDAGASEDVTRWAERRWSLPCPLIPSLCPPRGGPLHHLVGSQGPLPHVSTCLLRGHSIAVMWLWGP